METVGWDLFSENKTGTCDWLRHFWCEYSARDAQKYIFKYVYGLCEFVDIILKLGSPFCELSRCGSTCDQLELVIISSEPGL